MRGETADTGEPVSRTGGQPPRSADAEGNRDPPARRMHGSLDG